MDTFAFIVEGKDSCAVTKQIYFSLFLPTGSFLYSICAKIRLTIAALCLSVHVHVCV